MDVSETITLSEGKQGRNPNDLEVCVGGGVLSLSAGKKSFIVPRIPYAQSDWCNG